MMIRGRHVVHAVAALSLLISTGCATLGTSHSGGSIKEAVAVIHPTKGNTCHGVVRFVEGKDGVRIIAALDGLSPAPADHAFHIHTFGDATLANGKSAGGHYNPEHHKHGRPTDAERHAGDLGNIKADGTGKGYYDRVDDHFTIAGSKNPILGRAVIIHAGQDTWVQPTGGAGARIGIGVIGIAKPAGK